VVLTAAFKLVGQVPTPTDPSAPPHKFTLTNEDGSYTKTLTLPSDAQPGPTDGVSTLTFDDLTDGHTYTLQGEEDDGASYELLPATPYHQIGDDSSPGSSPAPASSPPGG
jgi:hypothetical protein